MSNGIQIHKVEKSRLAEIDFNNIPFGKVFSDHMFVADYIDGEWSEGNIVPLEKFSVHPGNLAWHYGQSIFEGMKASIDKDGNPMLMRPMLNIKRMNISAERMCMPTIPEDMFLEALEQLIKLEKDWIPTQKGSSLYIRPFMVGMDETLGVRPSDTYRFMILTLPVGPYYPKPVALYADSVYIRAAEGGVGFAKTAGNYAASLYPSKLAKDKGYDQVLWLDAKESKYAQEVGTMNIFFKIDGKFFTPDIGTTVLNGTTRQSVIELLRAKGHDVVEANVSIDDVFEAHSNGTLEEVFGTGTAAVIVMVKKIGYKEQTLELDVDQYESAPMLKSYIEDLRAGDIEDEFEWLHVIA